MRQLARELQERRAAGGLSLARLSQETGYGKATLARFLDGQQAPAWPVVAAIARSTNASHDQTEDLRQLWEAAWNARRPPGANKVMESAARETQQRTVVNDLYQLAGRPSVRELEDATGVSRSVVHRVLTGQSMAGARKVADGLLARLAPDEQEEWTAKITNVFEGETPGSEDTGPFRTLHAGEREMVAEAFADFERSLQRVRNLIAHGSVQAPPELSAQVMLLAATMEHARSGRSPDPSAPSGAEALAARYRQRMQEESGGAASADDAASDRKDGR
ncbi:helix-turn-helix transcriptional regulator [Streptomyces sp. CL7]|uniref:helix-turn-helix domain-containing protein n=1 Tax=Streptomyces sp. CL7 TaxID=3096006 RepID=UPI002A75B042|nr:helix-turn-helix transcriptional regulator [Streptomyces sp. CL7]WPP31434.1 helix-turn-helix transcriptional regulator [Streptomyces sp. CL7]